MSGQFKALPSSSFLVFHPQDEIIFDDWRRLGSSYLMIGDIEEADQNMYEVNYELFDVLSGRSVLKGEVTGDAKQLRSIAHRISDDVYEKITGIPGIFSTRILYVVANRKSVNDTTYELIYADMDGHRAVSVLESKEPLLAPAVTRWQEGCLCLFREPSPSHLHQDQHRCA